jgi:hypothetical protein
MPAPPVPSPATAHARRVRARRVLLGVWATGCALVVAGPLLAAVTSEASLAGMILGGAFLLPLSGLVLGCLALFERSREAVLALAVAAVSLAGTIGLVGPASRAGTEVYVAAHQPELDALAVEIRATLPPDPVDDDPLQGFDGPVWERFGERLRRLGVMSVRRTDGGLLIATSRGMGFTLVYADGGAGPSTCAYPRLRFVGGRWFEWKCQDRRAVTED